MDFAPDPDHELIREGVRAVCAGFDDPYWRHHDQHHEFPWDFYRAMADGGWIGIAIPEQYGGGGRGITEASIVLEEVAASGAAMNGCSAIHLSIFGMEPVNRHGSEEMRQQYLPRVASGDLHVAFGVTEPDAGTDTTAITTRAVRDGDHYVVRGRKVWTTKALVLREGAAARAHDAARGVRQAHRRADAAPGRPAAARGRHHADREGGPQRRRVVRGALRRPAGRR